jgi:uncharacterized membrane protein
VRAAGLRSAVYLAGGLGLLVAIFAAGEFHDASLQSICSINSFFSCATVDRSGLTTTLGIQDYLWGIGGYVVLLVGAGIAERYPRDVRPAYALAALATAAVGLSGDLLYVQLARIHALCVVCATAEGLGVILWIAALALAVRTRRGTSVDAPVSAPPTSEPDA